MVNPTPAGHRTIASRFDFETTLTTLRESIGAAEMMVLHEIDTQAIIARAGISSGGLRQLLYFHPRFMKRVLDGNASAVIEAPLKFVVREVDSGGVNVHFWQPTATFGRYAGLESLGAELEPIAEKIAATVA
jgi:uncharacterized protein (DUF302 family)